MNHIELTVEYIDMYMRVLYPIRLTARLPGSAYVYAHPVCRVTLTRDRLDGSILLTADATGHRRTSRAVICRTIHDIVDIMSTTLEGSGLV
jgi:hypothetical protein